MSSDEEVAEVNSSSDEEAVEVDSSSDEDENTDVTAASPAEDKGNPDGDDGVNTAGREKAIDMVTTPPKEKSSSESPKKSTSKEIPEQQLASKKTPSSNKSSTPAGTPGSRKKSGKPTYLDMVHEAIVALKDRTGSSVPAISKWILAEYESNKSIQPNSFKNCVSNAIKQGMKEERFVKVKSSYKVNNVWVKKQKAAAKAKETEKKKREIKRKKEVQKAKLEKKKKEDDEKKKQEEVKKKAEIERKNKENELTPEQLAAKEERRKKREEAEARAKYLADRLRKRRFPMEDTKLHAEDKELGVKPPEDVTKRPTLPHTLGSIVPPHLRSDSRKSSVVVNASSCGNGSWLGSGDSRGLITDALHIYHFFCGDVGFADDNHPVPKFSLKTLLHAVDEVLNGNAKAAKSLPPLLTHLFVTALRILTAPVIMDVDEKKAKDDDGMEAIQSRLQDDLSKLGEGLNPVSWSQICLFYMDLMERYYTSDASLEVGVLPGENTLDISYLWDDDKMEEDGTGAKDLNEEGHKKLPKNYNAYLGDVDGALAKGYSKLQKQNDPWNIPAEELLALLRALTDDIIANNRELSEDITGRGAKLYELQKSKNAALLKYRKVKLAFEGPKKPTKPKKPENNESVKDSDGKEGDDAGAKDESDKASVETPFVPTATKQQFLAAEKAHIKAVEAYDNGLRKLISRTEPIGFDRHLNSYYFFPHDPEMLHVEVLKNASLPPEIKKLDLTLNPNSSWRYIDTKSLFEQFLGGLDIRGIRENELFHVCSGLTVLKRKLLDENRDKSRSLARAREKEELERKLENAKSACADDGRRSGRLAGIAQDDLKKIEDEIKITTISHAAEEQQEHEALKRSFDYSVLTGLEMMTVLNANRNQNEVVPLAYVSCHRLWMDEQVDGNGTLQVLVESLSELEGKINHFSPWKREDVTREGWRKQLSDISKAWAQLCEMQLGPSQDDKAGDATSNDENSSHDDTATPKTKKPKLDQSTPGTSEKASITYIISTVKQCLIDLELRMFEMSGIKKATEAADAVGDNREASSDDDEDGDNSKSLKCWRRKINALKRIPTQRHVLIRDIIVAAITAARKTHHNQVAADLKKALQLHRPSAAGEARVAAIEVLENYGGYDGLDEDEDVDFDELVQVDAVDQKLDEAAAAEIESMICDEVTMMSGSLGGEDNADRTDWFDVMKSCKSISRLATLTQYFLSKAEGVLSRIEEEKEILDSLLGVGSKARKSRSSKKNHDSSTPVWCDASLTDKIVKGKVSGYPWWPARICKPADTSVSNSLADLGNTLISFVGEPSVYIVTDKDVKDFVEEIEEDLSQYDQNTIENLHESTKMARKIWRTQNRGLASPWVKKSKPRFAEEKKTAH